MKPAMFQAQSSRLIERNLSCGSQEYRFGICETFKGYSGDLPLRLGGEIKKIPPRITARRDFAKLERLCLLLLPHGLQGTIKSKRIENGCVTPDHILALVNVRDKEDGAAGILESFNFVTRERKRRTATLRLADESTLDLDWYTRY